MFDVYYFMQFYDNVINLFLSTLYLFGFFLALFIICKPKLD